jgi:hypothetical protein
MYRVNRYKILIAVLLCFLATNIFALVGMGGIIVVSAAPELSSIKINEQLPAYGSVRLTVTGTYIDGTSYYINSGILWESSNTSIATVDSNGNVTFTGQRGTVTISASYEGKSHSVSATAQQAPSSSLYIRISGLPNVCQKGGVYALTVQALYIDNSIEELNNRYISFVSSDNNIASVNSEGVVNVHSTAGGFAITATYRDKVAFATSILYPEIGWSSTNNSSTAEIIGVKILGDIPKEPFNSTKLQAKGEYSDGYYRDLPNSVTWTSSNNDVVRVTNDGTIYYGGHYGVATVTAKYDKYEESININIDKGLQIYEAQRRAAEAKVLIENKQKAYFNDAVVDTNSIITVLEHMNQTYQNTNSVAFRDVKNHWAEKEINTAKALGIVSGFADNTFKPDNKITRAEFAAMIYKGFSVRYYIDNTDKTFKDVRGKWHQDNVMALKNSGIINGYSDDTFRPNNYITRGEMIAILSRLIVKEGINVQDSKEKYIDLTSNYWAKKEIDKLYSLGALDRIGKNKLEPDKSATRADVVNVIVTLLQNIDKNSK